MRTANIGMRRGEVGEKEEEEKNRCVQTG